MMQHVKIIFKWLSLNLKLIGSYVLHKLIDRYLTLNPDQIENLLTAHHAPDLSLAKLLADPSLI